MKRLVAFALLLLLGAEAMAPALAQEARQLMPPANA
jgi:hypothetical protein